MDHIEVSGRTREEAIMKASVKLETPSDGLDIEVVSEGSKGFLGFGSKPYIIRASKREEAVVEEPQRPEQPEEIQEHEDKEPDKEAPVKKKTKEDKQKKEGISGMKNWACLIAGTRFFFRWNRLLP